MALVSSVDYVAKRIHLSVDTIDSSLDTILVYKEVRALRRTTPEHQKFAPMIIAGGNITKILNTSATPAYVQLLNGCRIVPYDTSHSLKLIRDTFTDDGYAGRDCFDRNPLYISPTTAVDIDVDFSEIEIRYLAGGGGTSPADIWSYSQRKLTGVTDANVKQVNSAPIYGIGTDEDPWREYP